MKTTTEKRQRGPNYTQREKDVLLSIVAKQADIIENKKTNAITSQEKDTAWEEIATEFNAMAPNCINRSTDSLRKFYENQKKDLRKRKADERMEFMRTGGGPPPKPQVTASDEKLLSLVNNKTIYGLQNSFDADRNIEIERSSAPEEGNYIYEFSQDDNEPNIMDIEKRSEVNTPMSSNVPQEYRWKRYKTANLQETPSAELQSSLLNTENSSQTSSVSRNKDFRRRRPATVVRALSSSHIADKYDTLLDKRLIICNYEESKLKNNSNYEKVEHDLRTEALKIDILIKKEQLRLLQEK